MALTVVVLLIVAALLFLPVLVTVYALNDAEVIREQPRHRGTTLVNTYGLTMLFLFSFIFALLDGEFASSLKLTCLIPFLPYGMLFALLLTYRRPKWLKACAIASIVIFTLAIRPIDWGTYKPFLRQLDQVKTGMTIEQVETLMGGYRAGSLPTTHPLFTDTACSNHPNLLLTGDCVQYYAPHPNLNPAMITFRQGHVNHVYYDNE